MLKKILLFNLLFCVLIISGCSIEKVEQLSYTNDIEPELITVYLSGEIKIPGEYKVSPHTKLNQLIYYAGGFLPGYDNKNIDYSLTLYNGQVLHFINLKEQTTEKININEANKQQLMTLPNIGEVTAQNIINYRNSVGKFLTINHLLEVNGIGEKKLNEIKEYITL